MSKMSVLSKSRQGLVRIPDLKSDPANFQKSLDYTPTDRTQPVIHPPVFIFLPPGSRGRPGHPRGAGRRSSLILAVYVPIWELAHKVVAENVLRVWAPRHVSDLCPRQVTFSCNSLDRPCPVPRWPEWRRATRSSCSRAGPRESLGMPESTRRGRRRR